jgi:hypothetical protein
MDAPIWVSGQLRGRERGRLVVVDGDGLVERVSARIWR